MEDEADHFEGRDFILYIEMVSFVIKEKVLSWGKNGAFLNSFHPDVKQLMKT